MPADARKTKVQLVAELKELRRQLASMQELSGGDSERDTSQLTFTDVFDLTEIQKVQDAFAKATGVASIITEPDGASITQPSNYCRLCNDIIRRTEKGLANCIQSDALIGRHNPDGPIIQRCLSGGLWAGGASICVGDRHIANWLVCQVRNEAQNDDEMLAYAREIGADEEAFRSALAEVSVMSTEQFSDVCNALFLMANLVSKLAFQNAQQVRDIAVRRRTEEELRDYRDNLEELVEERTEELRSSEKRFRGIFDQTVLLMGVLDVDGTLLDVNQTALQFTGVERSTLLGKRFEDTPWWSHSEELQRRLRDALERGRRGERVQFEATHLRRDGEERVIDFKLIPILDEVGKVILLIPMGDDVTERKQAEEALRESEEKLRQITSSAGSAIMMIDHKGSTSFWNEAAARMFGWSGDEILGQYLHKFIAPERYLEQHRRAFSTFVETGQGGAIGSRVELIALRKDGTEFPVELSLTAVKLRGHWNAIGLVSDITERAAAEESVRKLSRAVEAVPVTVLITDTNGRIEYVNPRFTQVTGYTAAEAIGQTPRILNSGMQPRELYQELWATIAGGNEWKGEFHNKKKSGELYWEQASISPVRDEDGEITHYVAVKEDITEQKRIAQELAEAKEAAEDASRTKGEFLASMSHEIRTPMNAIIGMSHLALQTDLTPKQRGYINKVHASSQALLGIINDILDFSKIEAGKLDMEQIGFGLDEVLDNVADLISLRAEDKGLELLFRIDRHIPSELTGDPLRLGQVLTNLANNSLKFTESGEIVVAAKVLEQGDREVTLEFSVTDTGIGLSEEQIGRLFQPFSQADGSATRKYGGTGLGLAICKRLAEMMDGRIWVESEPGVGSTFAFTGVFGYTAGQEQDLPMPSVDIQGMRVLIVDDSAMAREILGDALASFALDVNTASSAAEAFGELQQRDAETPYDLVFMDWRMPAMNGIEATAQITSRLGLTNVPKVIMVTSHDHEEIREEAQAAGVCGLITKPVTNSMLLDAIMEAFGHDTGPKRRARRETTIDLAALAPIRGAKILLVEDNEINQQVATELLERAQLRVTAANTGKEGVEKALADGFELILMDIQMPEMDGFEATRRIRASDLEDAKTLPIIAMTAHAMAGDKEKSLEAGMNDHVTKPIDPNGLYATLLRWIPAGAREVPAHLSEAASRNDGDVAEIALPNVPGIDTASGLTRASGNRRLYGNSLRKFVRDYAGAREQLDAALAQEDTESAQRLAHTIKGVAGNIGARSTQQAAGALEVAIRDGKADTLPDLLGAFTEALNTLVASLRQAGLDAEETDAAAVQREVGAPERLLVLLSALEPHVKACKPKPSKVVIEEINLLQWPEAYVEGVTELGRSIENYQFDNAHAVLASLRRTLSERERQND